MTHAKTTPKTGASPATEGDGDENEDGGTGAANRPLNQRQQYFVTLCLAGTTSRAEAYRTAYCKPDATPKLCADKAYILANRPNVAAALRQGAFAHPHHSLLSKDDLLKGYAGIFVSDRSTAHERLRAGREYSILAGYMPKEWDLPPDGEDGTGRDARVVINVFKFSPSVVAAKAPIRNVTPAQAGNGNGNGNGNH